MTIGDGLATVHLESPLELWLLDPSGDLDESALAWLSAEERHRAAQFRFAHHRHRYLSTHIALRWLVSQRLMRPPESIRFLKGSHGKPAIGNAPELHFSLSYARHIALIGIGSGHAMGVDVEPQQPMPDALELARTHFTAAEFIAIQNAASDDERRLLFLRGWTRKEACLKAIGTGLHGPTTQMETGLHPAHATVQLSASIQLEVASFTIQGHIASWARLL